LSPTIFIFAEWFKEHAPIYSILAKAAAFTILLLIFDIAEEVVVEAFKGKTFAESFPHVGDGSPRIFLYDYYLRHCVDPILLVQGNW
jgi:hypothetical protein